MEYGAVVAFVSGLSQINDPWGDLVNYFRDLTNAQVKYRLIQSFINRQPPAGTDRGGLQADRADATKAEARRGGMM
jgi:hypothetical protein